MTVNSPTLSQHSDSTSDTEYVSMSDEAEWERARRSGQQNLDEDLGMLAMDDTGYGGHYG